MNFFKYFYLKYFIFRIRLGDHNITSLVDCQKVYGGVDCNNPFLRVEIENYIIHELYDQSESIHDISLIRLQKSVKFTGNLNINR